VEGSLGLHLRLPLLLLLSPELSLYNPGLLLEPLQVRSVLFVLEDIRPLDDLDICLLLRLLFLALQNIGVDNLLDAGLCLVVIFHNAVHCFELGLRL